MLISALKYGLNLPRESCNRVRTMQRASILDSRVQEAGPTAGVTASGVSLATKRSVASI